MEYNGTTISQSITIARFLAKEFNLAGKNRIEEAQADMIVDCVADLLNGKKYTFSVHVMQKSNNLENKIHIDSIAAAQIFIKEKDETRKAEMMKTFQTEGIPNAIKMFEKLLSANGGKFFVGKEVLCMQSYLYLFWFLTHKFFQNPFSKVLRKYVKSSLRILYFYLQHLEIPF